MLYNYFAPQLIFHQSFPRLHNSTLCIKNTWNCQLRSSTLKVCPSQLPLWTEAQVKLSYATMSCFGTPLAVQILNFNSKQRMLAKLSLRLTLQFLWSCVLVRIMANVFHTERALEDLVYINAIVFPGLLEIAAKLI